MCRPGMRCAVHASKYMDYESGTQQHHHRTKPQHHRAGPADWSRAMAAMAAARSVVESEEHLVSSNGAQPPWRHQPSANCCDGAVREWLRVNRLLL